MYRISKLRDDNVLHFAAEELKKYLRMMMPDCGEIEISLDTKAQDGFRLGLLEDFGLPCEAEDAELDDIVHIDTTENGGIQDGSNKSFFPNGFIDHIYGATLWDNSLDYEAELEDYFSHVYGKDWKKARAYLDKITAVFDPDFMWGKKSADPGKGEFYNPEQAKKLEEVKEITAEAREFIKTHLAMPTRPQTVSWRLLLRHTEWCERFAEVLIEVCKGHRKYSMERFLEFTSDFGKYDFEMERYFDFGLACAGLLYIVKNVPKVEF